MTACPSREPGSLSESIRMLVDRMCSEFPVSPGPTLNERIDALEREFAELRPMVLRINDV
jgi:hypothetical protein